MPFSDEERRLIAAIHADPMDDAPRLVYADWCEEHGLGDLAEFIRIQCREPYFRIAWGDEPEVSEENLRAKRKEPRRTERAIALVRRLYATDRFPEYFGYDEYSRGLPLYEMDLSDGDLDRPIEELDLLPTPLARYRPHIWTSRLAEWLEHPLMHYVEVLRLSPASGEFTAGEIRCLAASPLLDRLEELGLLGDLSPEAKGLAADLLEPRVPVNYDP